MAILITIYSLASSILLYGRNSANRHLPALPYLTSSGKTYQIVAESELPEYPTPIGVTDAIGRKKWTISIPERLGFPLQAADYADICSHISEVATHISHKPSSSTFLDVAEAQDQGLLPKARTNTKTGPLPLCSRSLTYVLDATDAGFGSSLMGMWVSYALAKKESRAFFIDDSQFAYGTYTTFFKPPPQDLCRPPPPSQRLPCPSQARHLVVSAATFQWNFGADFQATHSSSDLFNLARQGYEALFHLRSDDADYVATRISELRNSSPVSNTQVIGIHLRRGDRHPFTLAYSQAYLPPTMYLDAASELASSIAAQSREQTVTILATDDPELYGPKSPISHLPRAQERIALASKSTLPEDSGIGWEGGFFAALFFSLGLPPEAEWQKRINSPLPSRMVAEMGEEERNARDYRTDPTKAARDMRALIGRAWLLDLAVLGQGSDGGVVCAVSSMTCRLLAVMLGKEKVEEGLWRNLETGYEWRAFDV